MRTLHIIAGTLMSTMSVYAQNGAVDVHSHLITPRYLQVLEKHNALLDEGFPLPAWDVDAHLKMMDAQKIEFTLLTLPAPQPWWGDAKESRAIIRQVNLESADIVRRYPKRFHFYAALPLPDVAAAVDEACFALDSLGAVGVKLATNVYGQYLGDAALEPLMAELDRRHAVVIIHPHKPSPVNDSIIQAAPLAIYEYPAETTRAVINMIARGVTMRYPNIKWVVPHCGAFLPLAITRMKGVHPIMMRAGLMKPIDWQKATANLYYDLAGNLTQDVLQALLNITDISHILYGSDYPYVNEQGVAASKTKKEQVLSMVGLSKENIRLIMHDNAARLFNLNLTPAPNNPAEKSSDMLIRIAEVEVYPQYLEEYMKYALTVGETSVREEHGVVAIFPMVTKQDATHIRIVEIYRNQEAYETHIASSHFQTYKQGTLHMVKHLELVDVNALNAGAMGDIFKKIYKQ